MRSLQGRINDRERGCKLVNKNELDPKLISPSMGREIKLLNMMIK